MGWGLLKGAFRAQLGPTPSPRHVSSLAAGSVQMQIVTAAPNALILLALPAAPSAQTPSLPGRLLLPIL